ncbi:MAG TPA: hypothetical protein GXZ51_04135 [Acholeplasma sp.]|nr:hypothetical protein [Acholeplasma sp.]
MLGKIETYKVDRETDIGYTLIKDGKEYFLHRNETNFAKLKPKDLIKGFLYLDKKGREAVTMVIPKVTVDQAGLGKVVTVNHSLGCFVNIGISKDILLSKDNLPYNLDYWPEVESNLYGILRVKKDKLYFNILRKDELMALEKTPQELDFSVNYLGLVYFAGEKGINLLTEDLNLIFIARENLRKEYKLGEKVEFRITEKLEDQTYLGMLPGGVLSNIEHDSKIILDYLKSHRGTMPYASNTSPMIIQRVFGMSKSSFKKALGNLYKKGEVELLEDKTILKKSL